MKLRRHKYLRPRRSRFSLKNTWVQVNVLKRESCQRVSIGEVVCRTRYFECLCVQVTHRPCVVVGLLILPVLQSLMSPVLSTCTARLGNVKRGRIFSLIKHAFLVCLLAEHFELGLLSQGSLLVYEPLLIR